jgi:PAS domain S-box-containing protein
LIMLLAAVTTSSVDRRQSEHRLRLVIDTLPAMVWSKSPDGSADFVNQRFREYTGLSVEEGLGWGWMRNAFHPEDRAEEEWRAAFAAGQPFEKEARLRRADGTYRCFLLRAGSDPIPPDKGGPVLGVLPNSDYESDKIDLRHGDVLVLYTDGAVEAENQAGEQYSATRLAKIASMYSQQSADELLDRALLSPVRQDREPRRMRISQSRPRERPAEGRMSQSTPRFQRSSMRISSAGLESPTVTVKSARLQHDQRKIVSFVPRNSVIDL